MLRRKTSGPVRRLGAFSDPLVNLRWLVGEHNYRARVVGFILTREKLRGRPEKCDDPTCAHCRGPIAAVMGAIAEAVVRSVTEEREPDAASLN